MTRPDGLNPGSIEFFARYPWPVDEWLGDRPVYYWPRTDGRVGPPFGNPATPNNYDPNVAGAPDYSRIDNALGIITPQAATGYVAAAGVAPLHAGSGVPAPAVQRAIALTAMQQELPPVPVQPAPVTFFYVNGEQVTKAPDIPGVGWTNALTGTPAQVNIDQLCDSSSPVYAVASPQAATTIPSNVQPSTGTLPGTVSPAALRGNAANPIRGGGQTLLKVAPAVVSKAVALAPVPANSPAVATSPSAHHYGLLAAVIVALLVFK